MLLPPHLAGWCHLQGPSGGVCLKQALPFVRCVGEGWPLSQDRARIEAEALQLEHKLSPQHTPEVRKQALIAA
jgi:5-methylthioribose kinase